jgi:hypothetical protein
MPEDIHSVSPFETVAAYKRHGMTVVDACKLLHVSRSGFYAWRNRKPGKRTKENKVLSAYILGIHRSFEERYKVCYGVRRIHAELRLEHGMTCTKSVSAGSCARWGCMGRSRNQSDALRAIVLLRAEDERLPASDGQSPFQNERG